MKRTNYSQEFAVSCSAGRCSSNTELNWFGCCTGTGSDSCHIATRCVASASVDACLTDSSCYNDQYLTACTVASAAFCVQMNSIESEKTFSHFVCAATSTVVQVLASSTGAAGSGSDGQTGASATSGGDETKSGSAATGAVVGGANAGPNAAATTLSTGAAAMQTAGTFVGALGVVAMLF